MIIRKAAEHDAMGIARVHVDSWKSTYKGIIFDDYLEKISYEGRYDSWQKSLADKNQNTYVAVDVYDRIVGFASYGSNRSEKQRSRYQGELYAIYILNHYQQTGVGKELLKTVVENFLADNIESMSVWVLANNPSRSFYEHFGAKVIESIQIKRGEQNLEEISYGWEDLNQLLSNHYPTLSK